MDHYAISPQGFVPGGGRVVLRVLAYTSAASLPRMRLRIQAVTPAGEPIAEDPLVSLEDVDPQEVREMARASRDGGWEFLPVPSPTRTPLG